MQIVVSHQRLFANLPPSWECGIIFPVPADAGRSGGHGGGSKQSDGDTQSLSNLEIFRDHVPVPSKSRVEDPPVGGCERRIGRRIPNSEITDSYLVAVPGEKYETKRPWFFQG